jgi:hypothetical protein
MPTHETFSCPPIGDFVRRYLSGVSVDPYARNTSWAQFTNDLNPLTKAEYHMDATEFILKLRDENVRADVVLLDPPYSPRQVKECYDSIGLVMAQDDALLGKTRKRLKDAVNQIVPLGGVVLSFGWNTVGMGAAYEIEEIMLVCHGSDHNDTICLAERRIAEQQRLFA